MKKPDLIIWYSKGLKHTGKPIIVRDVAARTSKTTDYIRLKDVEIRMKFNNAFSKAKECGATTVLEVWK